MGGWVKKNDTKGGDYLQEQKKSHNGLAPFLFCQPFFPQTFLHHSVNINSSQS